MPRRHSLAVILGALALVPLSLVGAQIAQRIIVEPVTEAMPGSLVRAVEDVLGGESGCASSHRSFPFGSNHPTAKAFLERNDVGDRPGARKMEHLYVIESDVKRRPGYEPLKYQASAVPVFENDACQGVRFTDVAPDSVYAHLGIRTDDLIRRVDGREIDTPEQGLGIYGKLLQGRRVEVELERHGRPTLNVYKLD